MDKTPTNFSIVEKSQGFKDEDLFFITSSNKVKSMIGLSFGEKVNQVQSRQKLLIMNIKGVIKLTNKKRVVGKARREDIDFNIEEIKSKSKNLSIEIAKFKTAAKIDGNEEIEDYEGYTSIINDKIEDGMEDLTRSTVLQSINQSIMNKVLMEDSEFFTNFVAEVLRVGNSDGVIPFLQNVAKTHGYKLLKIIQQEPVKVVLES